MAVGTDVLLGWEGSSPQPAASQAVAAAGDGR